MNKHKIFKIINFAWPFVFLAIFIWLGILYILPLLPDRNKSQENIIAEEYNIINNQNDLNPSNGEGSIKEIFGSDGELLEGNKIFINEKSNLKEILSNIKDGDILTFDKGIYKLNLETEKNIVIIGQGESTVLIEESDKNSVIKLKSNQAFVNNLIISNSRIGLEAEKSELKVKNVKFLNLTASALYTNDSKAEIDGSYIYNSGSALKFKNSEGKVENSIIKSNNKSGVQLIASDFIIKNNIISENKSYGVFVDNDSKADIKENFIQGNFGYNVRFENLKKIYD